MAKNKISEFSAVAANNTDIANIDIAEGCAPSGINNAIRELMAQLKDQQTGTDLDSFTVGGNLAVTGTTTLTGAVTATSFLLAIKETIYPIGSIYTSTVATNPATLLGVGTWVAFGVGRVLLGVGGAFPTAGATGGSADAVVVSHTHAVTDPGHLHSLPNVPSAVAGSSLFTGGTPNSQAANNTGTATTGISINATGVSGTNANLQPYIVVYMWNRTA